MTPYNVHNLFDLNITIFARFYSPDCRISRISKPEFEKASHHFKNIIFLNIDCSVFSSVCSKYSIIAFPSYLLFKNGRIPYKVFTFPRTAESMIEFIEYHTLIFNPISVEKSIFHINFHTYNDFFLNSGGCKILHYHIPFFKSSRLFEDFFHEYIHIFRGDRNVEFGRINCHLSRLLCSDVYKFPWTRIYNQENVVFEGIFSSENHFVSTINEKCNTSRQINGRLLPNVGIDLNTEQSIVNFSNIYQNNISQIDQYIESYITTSGEKEQYEQNPYVKDNPTSSFIVRLMKNVVKYGPDILAKYKDSIEKQYHDQKVSVYKLDDFDIKLNIINVFIRCFYP